jgi:hypothetical protein
MYSGSQYDFEVRPMLQEFEIDAQRMLSRRYKVTATSFEDACELIESGNPLAIEVERNEEDELSTYELAS